MTAPTYAVERAKQESGNTETRNDTRKSIDAVVTPENAAAYGEVLHRALLGMNTVDLIREFELPEELRSSAEETVRKVHASDIWRRATASPEMYQEAPFILYEENAEASDEEGTKKPRILRGVIDLVFRNATGWSIIDFKSDAVTREAIPAAAARHRPQLRAYAKAWEKLTATPVTETALYFLHPDICHPLDTEEQASLF